MTTEIPNRREALVKELASQLTGQHLIAGQWQSETDVERFQSLDPVANQTLALSFAEAGERQIDAAVTAAGAAFVQYRQTRPQTRAAFLEAIATELENDSVLITAAAMLESGLPQARINGELGRTANQLRLFASELRETPSPLLIDKANPERTPLPKPELRLTQLPLGPVAVFGASNFPLAFSTAGGDSASALAAGCPVIVKGHPAHPATSELVARAIARAISRCDVPSAVFSLLQGRRPELSTGLVSHSGIQAVGFTGSFKVGRLLADCCAARAKPIPFYGELGSINPQLLLPGKLQAEAETLASHQHQSMLMAQGQFCTSPGLILALADSESSQKALARYRSVLSQAITETEAAPMLTPGIAESFQTRSKQLLANPALELLAQGKAAAALHHTRPLLLETGAESLLANPDLMEEVFGPFALLVTVKSEAELQAVIQALDGQLTASVHATSSDLQGYPDVLEALQYKVGRLIFNQMPTGVEVCHAMNHGGPFPASTDLRSTSVGTQAMARFLRPLSLQNLPSELTNSFNQGQVSDKHLGARYF